MRERAAIPLGEFPDPALAYAVEGGDARVTAANEVFERRFDGSPSETPLSDVFDRFVVRGTTGGAEPLAHVVRGDRVGIFLEDSDDRGPFFVRVIPTDGDAGYLVFTDLEGCPGLDAPPAVDRVSSVISHDLRNPLDVAKAHLQAARETGDPEHFESVASAHDRMERIIRDVLTLTHGDEVVDPTEDVSVETAATKAWDSVDTEGATLEVAEPLPTATADPDRLRRLFENLFRNSVEHSSTSSRQEAGDSVEHSPTSSRQEAGDSVEHTSTSSNPEVGPTADGTVTITVGAVADGFYVADDGPGIPPERRDLVFEPGYSTREGGTGLGLAIVDRIVAAHGWELTLTAADDGGVRFEIRR
jgi:hypothetical protein